MLNQLQDNQTQSLISVGIAGLFAVYGYTMGWQLLSGLGLMATAGVGSYALFKLADLCISLKGLVEELKKSTQKVNDELLLKVSKAVEQVDELAKNCDTQLKHVSTNVLPELQQTLTNAKQVSEEAKGIAQKASERTDALLNGQLVLQLGAGSSNAGQSVKSKPH